MTAADFYPPLDDDPPHGSEDDDGAAGSRVPRRPTPSAGSASAEPTVRDRGDRVEDHVKGRVQRSYLKQDGWWAQLVLDEFAFLHDLGYSLTGSEWAGVHFHHRGHFVAFVGPRRDVSVGYDPEDTKTIHAHVVEHDPPRFIGLDGLIAERLPGTQPPRRRPLDREAVEANVRWWADGLRRIAADVL